MNSAPSNVIIFQSTVKEQIEMTKSEIKGFYRQLQYNKTEWKKTTDELEKLEGEKTILETQIRRDQQTILDLDTHLKELEKEQSKIDKKKQEEFEKFYKTINDNSETI